MRYNCIIYAFARVLGISPEELAESLPHDGLSQIPDQDVQRSHHIQEIIDAASVRGVWICPIELVPQALYVQINQRYPVLFGNDISNNFKRFKRYLRGSTGVVTGIKKNVGHAAFWDGQRCHDANYSWDLWDSEGYFVPDTYWRAVWAN